jgi:uncharacterized protein YdbL (DUF1318 family)
MTPRHRSSTAAACAVLLAFVSLAAPASALDLETARSQGLVGEQVDGYIGAVSPNPSAEVRTLVAEVNGKRRASYQEIATRNGTGVAAVAALAAQKLIARLPAGSWVGENGRWYQKK